MFLTSEQTGGPQVYSLRRHNFYLAVDQFPSWRVQEFDIEQLAGTLGRGAGETWQEHRSLILAACKGGKLFEWLDIGGAVFGGKG